MFQFAKEGYPFILFFLFLVVLSVAFRIHYLTVVFLMLTLFMLFFFRDPERATIPDRNTFYAPADGRIILIKEIEEKEILNSRALMVSIFMSPLNVHVNRSPSDGIVREVRHYPGKFLSAFKDESAIVNEHITMLLETEHGKIALRQVAGFLARRAVCRVKRGDMLQQGQRYGIIKFSSRVDVFLPLNTQVKVKLNDRVKAGESILGIIE